MKRSTVIVTLTAAMLMALGLARVRAQRQTGQDRAAVELFRGHAVVAGEVLVAFRRSPDLVRLRAEIDTDTDAPVGAGRLWHARSRSRNVSSLLAHLSTRSDVLYAEPNYIVYAEDLPNDPRFPELWGLLNIGQTIGGIAGSPGADIGAAAAWDGALGSRNTVVGVVDTGIDYTHPDLAGNIWSAPASFSVTIGGQRITCAAGTHGFNAITRSCDPFDDHFHGTHVAGTIGAVGNNGVGVAGVNWFASIMGLKFLTSAGSGTVANAINAIEFAVQAKAAFPSGGANVRVLSNSWAGGAFSQALLDEINRANQSEMLFVAAAGNSASDNDAVPTYPASYAAPNVVAVAATSNLDALASFSNYGANSVHLGAPGVQVLSTLLGGTYGYLSGTSMATPHVSGAAALLLSRCTANTAAVKSLLMNNCRSDSGAVWHHDHRRSPEPRARDRSLRTGRKHATDGHAGRPVRRHDLFSPCQYRPPRSGARWAGRRRSGGVLRRHRAHRHRCGAAIRTHVDRCRGRQLFRDCRRHRHRRRHQHVGRGQPFAYCPGPRRCLSAAPPRRFPASSKRRLSTKAEKAWPITI